MTILLAGEWETPLQKFALGLPIGHETALPLRGTNQMGMRARNERLVLSLVRQHGALSKAEIARLTGLSAQTVSVIMRALEAEGLLAKGDPVRGKVGQPSVPMHLDENGAFFLGLKVGRRSLELVLTDFLGKVLARRMRVHTHPEPEATIAFAHDAIGQLILTLPPEHRSRIAGLGIAIPFFLWDWAQMLGVPPERMEGWRTIDIRAEIAARHSLPVFVQNDASSACAAELVFGKTELPPEFLYFYVGYFIGGGVVLNHALFSGAGGNSGALGPLPVPGPDGTPSQLIDVASLTRLESSLSAAGFETDSLWEDVRHWKADPAILDAWIDTAARGLAHAVVSACSIIDFGQVLIDGWLPRDVAARLVDRTRQHLGAFDVTGLNIPEIRLGTIGADARALGAASLPLSERFLIDTEAQRA